MDGLYYPDTEALNHHIRSTEKGFILVAYQNCSDYEGMVLCIMIRFDIQKEKYWLVLEWECLGLDLYGDTLQESYIYQFESLEKLLGYLKTNYAIDVTDIPVKYQFDGSQFPNPIYHDVRKKEFEEAWQRFQQDFKSGAFLDASLKLTYASDVNPRQ